MVILFLNSISEHCPLPLCKAVCLLYSICFSCGFFMSHITYNMSSSPKYINVLAYTSKTLVYCVVPFSYFVHKKVFFLISESITLYNRIVYQSYNV